MQISVEIPDDIANTFESDFMGLRRAFVEGLALEGARSGRLSRGQVRRLLGFATRNEVDGFLKSHGVAGDESFRSIQQDSEAILSLGHQ